MPDSSFDLKEIIARLQSEEWRDNIDYWLTYQDIWQDQTEGFRLAENLRMLAQSTTADDRSRSSNNPLFKTQVAAFQKAHSLAMDAVIKNHDTAYLYRLAKANTLRRNGAAEWEFYLSAQISLGIIYLRECRHQSHIRLDELRNLIKEWQSAHGQTSAYDDSQWYRALKTDRVKRLRFGSVD
jgi:hypothetical protein